VSRVSGVNHLRRTLNRIDPSAKRFVKKAVVAAAKRIEADAVGLAYMQDIKITGDMIASISYKVSGDGLSAHIGPGADRAYVRKNPFSNTALDKTLLSTTRSGKVRGYDSAKYIKDKDARWNFMKGFWAEFGTEGPIPQEPQPFMGPAYELNRMRIHVLFSNSIDRALRAAVR